MKRASSLVGLLPALLLLLFGLAACQPVLESNTVIDVTTQKPDDIAVVTLEDSRALIEVTSPSGIGGLTAALSAGEWPEEVAVRLHLRGLESLEIRYGDVAITTGLSSTGNPVPLMLSVTGPDGTVQSASPSADIYYPRITVNGADAAGPGSELSFPLPPDSVIEINLPAHFFSEAYPSFSVNWIDFYR